MAAIEDELLGDEVEREAEAVAEQKPAEPATEEVSYIEVVNRRRNILRGHTRAIVIGTRCCNSLEGMCNKDQFTCSGVASGDLGGDNIHSVW